METLSGALPYIQIALAVLTVAGVLIQRSDASLGEAFGGADSGGAGFVRRGAERVIFNATIVLSVLFVISTVLAFVVR